MNDETYIYSTCMYDDKYYYVDLKPTFNKLCLSSNY